MGCGSSNSSSTGLTDVEIKLVRETWQEFNDGDIIERGMVMFLRIFEKHPEMIPIWAFNSDSKTTEDHKNNPRLHNHIRKVMGGVGQAVAGLDDIPKTAPALEDLGYVHKQYGPTDNHYDAIGEGLLFAFETALGSKFTPDAKKAWVHVYQVVKGAMQKGQIRAD